MLAVTVIVFWMLLRFSRTLRVMRRAADRPVGQVASAVMLHNRLRERMTMAQVLALTGSLGERRPPADGAEESWRWRDAGSDAVTVHVAGGRIRHWTLRAPTKRAPHKAPGPPSAIGGAGTASPRSGHGSAGRRLPARRGDARRRHWRE